MSLLIRSSLLDAHGFAHGFSLRTGGVSEGPFESLNLARTVGDDVARVDENCRRFCAAIGCEAPRLFEASQVHGRAVVDVQVTDHVDEVRHVDADALVTGVPATAVAVRTADCLPLLIGDPETGVVAAVHAGWRGVVAGVVEAALERMARTHGVRVPSLLVALGPHIRADAFEVGAEVAGQIAAVAHGEDVIEAREPRPHADLARTVRAQLRHHGVADDRVDDVGGCTLSEPERFFSHRRGAGVTGRHLSAIVARSRDRLPD